MRKLTPWCSHHPPGVDLLSTSGLVENAYPPHWVSPVCSHWRWWGLCRMLLMLKLLTRIGANSVPWGKQFLKKLQRRKMPVSGCASCSLWLWRKGTQLMCNFKDESVSLGSRQSVHRYRWSNQWAWRLCSWCHFCDLFTQPCSLERQQADSPVFFHVFLVWGQLTQRS